MRILIVLFTFTILHLRWAQDYEYNRDIRLFYTFGRQYGNLAEFHRQRRESPCIKKSRHSESGFDFPELNFADYLKKGSALSNRNQGSYGCGKANIERNMLADNGEEVKPQYKYPWMTAFKRSGMEGVFCGGALITDTYILTAAHCLDRNPESLHKGVKSHLQPWKPNELRLFFVTKTRDLQPAPPVQRVIPHPGFEFKNTDHDIGLVKLSKPVPYTKYTRPICLPPKGIPVNIGKIFQIAGWGVEKMSSNQGSKALLEAKIKHVPFSMCEHKFKRRMKENYYCLKGLEGQSPCHGDSGGPMFREYEGTYYVLGVTSMHSSDDCDPDDTFIFTSVSSHIPWIKKVIGGSFPTGQQSLSLNRASSPEHWAISYDWPHSKGQQVKRSSNQAPLGSQWASSSNWAYLSGQRPSYASWRHSSGQWPLSYNHGFSHHKFG